MTNNKWYSKFSKLIVKYSYSFFNFLCLSEGACISCSSELLHIYVYIYINFQNHFQFILCVLLVLVSNYKPKKIQISLKSEISLKIAQKYVCLLQVIH